MDSVPKRSLFSPRLAPGLQVWLKLCLCIKREESGMSLTCRLPSKCCLVLASKAACGCKGCIPLAFSSHVGSVLGSCSFLSAKKIKTLLRNLKF